MLIFVQPCKIAKWKTVEDRLLTTRHVDVTATCHPHSRGHPWRPPSMAEPDTGRAILKIRHLFPSIENFKWNKSMEEEEQRLELISHAIRRLLEDNKNKKSSDRSSVDDGDENGNPSLLRDLLSQVHQISRFGFPEHWTETSNPYPYRYSIEVFDLLPRYALVSFSCFSIDFALNFVF